MTTIRLFGNDIKVREKEKEEEEKSIMLFGKRIFQHAGLNNDNKQQHYDRLIFIKYLPSPYLPPPNMCMAIQFIQGSQPVYIGCKNVENSDINVNLSRFLFPPKCSTESLHYMSRSEIENIVNEDDTGLNVSVMDPKGDLHAMKFNRWKSFKKRLVFNRGWNQLVRQNHLQKGDLLDLWHFRMPYNKPCFAINIIKND